MTYGCVKHAVIHIVTSVCIYIVWLVHFTIFMSSINSMYAYVSLSWLPLLVFQILRVEPWPYRVPHRCVRQRTLWPERQGHGVFGRLERD